MTKKTHGSPHPPAAAPSLQWTPLNLAVLCLISSLCGALLANLAQSSCRVDSVAPPAGAQAHTLPFQRAPSSPPQPVSAPPLPPPPPSPFTLGLAAFRSPATWCTSNPFLTGWGSSEFTAAAESLVASRGSLVRLALGEKYHAPAWAKFDVAPPLQNCAPLSRYPLNFADPLQWDDGGKLLCNVGALELGCVIYSLGSAGDFRFEMSMHASSPCEIFTFDCTPLAAGAQSLDAIKPYPRIHFHPICLGSSDDPASQYRSLSSIAAQFGHTKIVLLKMDIEGFENPVVEALYNQAAHNATSKVLLSLLPAQINMEVHWSVAMPDLAWSTRAGAAGLEAGDLAMIWVQLSDLGYVPITRENNLECPHCAEFTMVRAFC